MYLFKTYTRDSYEKEFGVQPPPFNPAKPAKTWFDTTVTTPTVTYNTLDLNTLKNISLVLKKEDAAAVNLPGAYRYTPWIVRPSECLSETTNAPLPPSPINVALLSTRQEAEQIAAEVGGTVSLATSPGGSMDAFRVACPANETRNVWEVQWKGSRIPVGFLLGQKYRRGVGAPGSWDLSGTETPVWVPVEPVVTSSNYARVPVRALLPNEKFSQTPFGVYIVRTDLEGQGTGSFTDADRAKLDEVLRIVRELQSKVK